MITYRIDARQSHSHEFVVTMTVAEPQLLQRLSLPVWIPGSYMVREFARHLSRLQARQGQQTLSVEQLDKATWQVACTGRGALTLSYRVYAFDNSVRTAWLDGQRAFFNGTSVCLKAEGLDDMPHRLELRDMPRDWQVATSMRLVDIDAQGRGTYAADDYDELIDHPVEMGRFWRGRFEAHGVPHEFVVAGALPDFDGERLLADTKRICEAEIAFWHTNRKPPIDRYVFMLNAVDDGYGGLEHSHSTALIAARRDLPQGGQPALSDGYVTLLGLISHEYFHTWNVKRMRPAEFGRLDHGRENYTQLLWFFEGFTSYYDDLFLVRSGLIDATRYLRLLAKTISGVLATPGRHVQSVAQASFDAWVKYYRQDENTPNATISYYAKGSLVALALDITLRKERRGTLDDVMRALWVRGGGGPVSERDIAQALAGVAGRPMDEELRAWVHGTDDLPLQALLTSAGLAWQDQPATLAQRLGIKVSESALTGVRVSQVMRGGAAEAAGLAPGDELLGIDGWRLRRLDDAQRFLQVDQPSELLLSRDQRLLRRQLALPATAARGAVAITENRLAPRAALALRKAWLHA